MPTVPSSTRSDATGRFPVGALAARLGLDRANHPDVVDVDTAREAVRTLETEGSADTTIAAYLDAHHDWARLHRFSAQLLLSAGRGDQPVSVTDLLRGLDARTGARTGARTDAVTDARNVALSNLLECYPDDEPLWDGIAIALTSWLRKAPSLPPEARHMMRRPRPITTRATNALMTTGHHDAYALVLTAHVAGHVELTDGHLNQIVEEAGFEHASTLLLNDTLRERLTDVRVHRLLRWAKPSQQPRIAAAMLRDPATVDRDLVLVTCWLIAEADVSDVAEWVTGRFPIAPTPALARLAVTASERSRSKLTALRPFGPGRPVDTLIANYAHYFDVDALERPGVSDLLEHAPLAVVEQVGFRSRSSVFADLLDARLDARLAAGAGNRDKARELIPVLAAETQPDTLTDLVDTALAIAT